MVYRQYFIIGSSIVFVLGILLVLIFANTFRMYDEKTASKEDRILNAVDIEVNEERIFNNAETIKQIKTNDIEIEDDISYMAKNITSMDDKINTNESSIDSIHDVLDGLKITDKKISLERLETIQKLLSENQIKTNKSLENHTVDVLVENLTEDKTKVFGRSEHMMPVFFNGKQDDIGKIVKVKIKDSNRNSLFGELLNISKKKVA